MGKKNKMESELRLKIETDDNQMYGQVSKILGHRWVRVLCLDGKTRLCRFRNAITGGYWPSLDDIVLISLKGYLTRKSDLLFVYGPSEVELLKELKEIPDNYPLSIAERLMLTLPEIEVKDRKSDFIKEEQEDNLKVNDADMVWNGLEWEKTEGCTCVYCIGSYPEEEEEEKCDSDNISENEDDYSSEEGDCSSEEENCSSEKDNNCSSESDDNEEDSEEEYSEKEEDYEL